MPTTPATAPGPRIAVDRRTTPVEVSDPLAAYVARRDLVGEEQVFLLESLAGPFADTRASLVRVTVPLGSPHQALHHGAAQRRERLRSMPSSASVPVPRSVVASGSSRTSRVCALRFLSPFVTAAALLAVGTTPAWAGGATPPSANQTSSGSDVQVGGTEKSAVLGTPTLTAAQLRETATKEAVMNKAMSRVGARAASHKSVSDIKQVSQTRTYWCGPATLVSLVKADGDSISQSTAADRLGTSSSGTAWYDGGYPMEKALDHYTGSHWEYVPAKLSYSPTSSQKTDYRNHLKFDVNSDWGIAGNALEVVGGPHLNKHPNKKIFHWVAIRGYDDSGSTTRYADPVAGSSVSWAGPVEAYNEIGSDKIATIMGDRGYIW